YKLINKRVKYEEPCDGRLSSTVPREGRVKLPPLTRHERIMAQKIIGRKQEIKELLDLYKENKPVFAVIYGRRRVGKTFLVRELFQDKMSFYHTGLSPYELSGQK
ncbi:ATP-binding protein, partial [Segatella copri]